MKKFGLVALMALLLVVLCVFGASAATAEAGNINVLDGYELTAVPADAKPVTTATEFAAMEADGVYYLDADITIGFAYGEFSGKLYGNGHTITAMGLNVFDKLTGAEIYDLTLEGNVSGTGNHVGGLATEAYDSAVVGITNKATVTNAGSGWMIVGGVLGYAENTTVRYCVNYGTITGGSATKNEARPGGIVGQIDNAGAWLVIENCVNYGDINGMNQTGGILARSQNSASVTIKNCVNFGRVYVGSSDSGSIAGKIICAGTATVENCINTGRLEGGTQVGMVGFVTGQSFYMTNCHNGCFLGCTTDCEHGVMSSRGGNLGAFVGGCDSENYYSNSVMVISGCTNTADLNGGSHSAGILCNVTVGQLTVENCTNSGNVTTTSGAVAGIGALISDGSAKCLNATFRNCVNTGKVKTANGVGGGIIAYSDAVEVVLENCFNGCLAGCTASCDHGKVECTSHGAGILANRDTRGVANSKTTVKDCTNTGRIAASNSSSGGLLGWCGSYTIEVTNSFNGCRNGCASCDHGVVSLASGNNNIGGIVGCVEGTNTITLKDCTNTADLGYGRTGGILGGCWSTANLIFDNCTNNGNINSTSNYDAAGILAMVDNAAANVTFKNCVNNGNITTPHNDSRPGGIASVTTVANLTVENCTNNGTLTLQGYGAGIVARVQVSGKVQLKGVINNGNVSSANQYCSGIMGWTKLTSNITCIDVHNKGNITCKGAVGGILGNWDNGAATLYFENCSNTGALQSANSANHIGGIIAWADNAGNVITIKNCTNTASLTSTKYNAAGIAGLLNGTVYIENCTNSGNMTQTTSTHEDSGAAGIVGLVKNASGGTLTVIGCSNTGNMTSVTGNAAGIVGRSNALVSTIIKNCTNSGTCTTTSADRYVQETNEDGTPKRYKDNAAGGIAAIVSSVTITVENCHNGCFSGCTTNCTHGQVTSSSYHAGGILAYNYTATSIITIKNCSNSGKIHAKAVVGGIAGNLSNKTLTIENCSNGCFNGCTPAAGEYCVHGMITNTDDFDFGGILGLANGGDVDFTTIKNCYNNGRLNGYNRGGGIAGVVNADKILVQGNINYANITTKDNYAGMIVGRVDSWVADGWIKFHDNTNHGVFNQTVSYVGGMVGYCESTAYIEFINCHNNGDLKSDSASGILCSAGGSVDEVYFKNCSNSGDIYAIGGGRIGGIIGEIWAPVATFVDCTNTGSVQNESSNDHLGGIAGAMLTFGSLYFENCVNRGNVTAGATNNGRPGGILGGSERANNADGTAYAYCTGLTMIKCYNYGNVTSGNYPGGLVSRLDPCEDAVVEFIGCENHGNVTGAKNHIGGLLGLMGSGVSNKFDVSIIDCKNTGTISKSGTAGNALAEVGGLVGTLRGRNVTVKNCVNQGEVNSGTAAIDVRAGGLVGASYGGVNGTSWIFENCTNKGKVNGYSAAQNGDKVYICDVGGFVGQQHVDAIFENCINEGAVHSESAGDQWNLASGGFFGSVRAVADVTATNCVNRGKITSAEGAAAGMVGFRHGDPGTMLSLVNCKNYGEIEAAVRYASGGIGYGYKSFEFIGCENHGKVTSKGNNAAGGLFGRKEANTQEYSASFVNCLNTGAIKGTPAGGICSDIEAASFVEFIDCTNRGTVNSGGRAGGIIGEYNSYTKGSNPVVYSGPIRFINCVNESTGTITASGVGAGIAAYVSEKETPSVEFTGCSNAGSVTGTYTGGIVGLLNITKVTTIAGCINTGTLTGNNNSGGIAGYINGSTSATIVDCTNQGQVKYTGTGNSHLGGIIGSSVGSGDTLVDNCINEGTIGTVGDQDKSQSTVKHRPGGIMGGSGSANVTFRNCTNKGDVYTNHYGGGFVCRLDFADGKKAVFENCVNEGDVFGNGTGNGGLLAWIEDGSGSYNVEFYNCTNSGNITAKNSGTGGIVGVVRPYTGDPAVWATSASLTIKNCTNTGKINNKTGGAAGGIAGFTNCPTTIENCINRGEVLMEAAGNIGGMVGGLYGFNPDPTVPSAITNCSNFGKIVGSTAGADNWSMVGGMVGHTNTAIAFNSCYNGCDQGCTTECDHGRLTGNNKLGFGGMLAKAARGQHVATLSFVNCVNDGVIGTTDCRFAYAGGMAGELQGYGNDCKLTVTDCTNNGNIYVPGATSAAGGILGWTYNTNTITNCVNNGNITVTAGLAGGIVARQGTTGVNIINCENNGTITSAGSAGGIAGELHGDPGTIHKFTGCVNNGTVTATGSANAGGMAASTFKELSFINCHNNGNVTAGFAAGGLMGRPMDCPNITAKGCTNTGAITAKGAGSAGGLFGDCYATYDFEAGSRALTIEDCHNSGNITLELADMTQSEGVGGLIGILQTRFNKVTIKNSSNSGTVSAKITKITGSVSLAFGGAIGLIPTTIVDGERTVEIGTIEINGFTNSGTINYTAGSALVGGVLGYIIPTGDLTVSINNAVNTANLTSKSMNLGGVVGHITPTGKADVTITNCRNSGTITSTASNVAMGGILGGCEKFTSLTVTNCINTGNVTSNGRPGGIIGVVYGNEVTIKSCTNMGKVDSNGNYPGGIASRIDAKTTLMEDCVNYGTVEAHQSQAGGMVGYMAVDGGLTRADCETTFKNCENHGTVTAGNTNAVWLGGIVGSYNNGDLTIDSCTNYGFIGTTIKATNEAYAGGIVGTVGNIGIDFEIKNCVNRGTVKAESTTTENKKVEAGGMIAQCHNAGTKITSCTNYGEVIAIGGAWGTGVAGGMMGTARTVTAVSMTDCVNYGAITAVTAKGGAAGGMLGYSHNTAKNDPTFDGCINYGKISANAYAAGILAYLWQQATFTDCANHGEILGYFPELAENKGNGVGGILCRGDCSAGGSVTFTNCVNTGTLTAQSYVAGMAGSIDDVNMTFTSCVNSGDVFSKAGLAAGLVGEYLLGSGVTGKTATFTGCVNTGDVETEGNRFAGGLVADSRPKCLFKNCVNTGDVTGDTRVGGIVGSLDGNGQAQYSEIKNCYVSGTITHNGKTAGGSNAVGGLAGYGWGTQYFTHNVIEANVVLKWKNPGTVSGDALPCAAVIAGYVNNGGEHFNYNFFTGTLNAGDGIAAYLGMTKHTGSTYKEPGATNINANVHHNYAMTDVVYPLVFATSVDSTKAIGQPIQIATGTSAANVVTTLGSNFKVVDGKVMPSAAETAYNTGKNTTAPTAPSTHTHSYATTYSKDATGHWYACSCGAVQSFAQHVYANGCDTTCETCGYTRTLANPAHVYTNACDTTCDNCGATRTVDANAHVYAGACDTTCENCGATRTVTNPAHVYTNACDTTCDICGATRTVAATAHVYTNACDTTCNTCGATRTVADSAHVYASNCDTTCENEGCTKTRTVDANAHAYDNDCDTTCNVCGVTRTVAATAHVYTNACDTTCNTCGATRTVNSHVYDGACDTTCNVCGTTRTATGTHAGEYACSDTCKVCGEAVTPGAHTYGFGCDTACDLCGAVRTEGLVHSGAYACAVECQYCKTAIAATGDHVYGNSCDLTCDKCGAVRELPANSHTYTNSCDNSCNNCGYVRADSELTHVWAKPCDITCDVCGKTVAAQQPHTGSFSCDTTCQWCECEIVPGAHTPEQACSETCKDCGATVPVEIAHTFASDCDPECDLCGKVRTELKHTFANDCDKVCEYCDFERADSELKHTFAHNCDAVCEYCDFTRDESELKHTYPYPCADKCLYCETDLEPGEHTHEHICSTQCFYCDAELEPLGDHAYSGACDLICNNCGYERAEEAAHQYHSICDTTCNICGAERIAGGDHKRAFDCSTTCMYCGATVFPLARHSYTSVCDEDCDVCQYVRTFADGLEAHTYDNLCDADCNNKGCDVVRPVGNHKGLYACSTECKHCGAEIEGADHVYSNVCDDTCGYCGEVTRTVDGHEGEFACSTSCKLCGAAIEGAAHTFDHDCDTDCNVCGETRTVAAHKGEFACSTVCKSCGAAIEGVAHTYTTDCDASCNVCGEIRTVSAHVYDSGCDADCNVCGATRDELTHTYDNACDETCNVCGETRSVEGHSYGSWEVTKPATTEETGLKVRVCEHCGHTDEREIDKLEPEEDDDNNGDSNEGEGTPDDSQNGSDGNGDANQAPSTDAPATEEDDNTTTYVIIAIVIGVVVIIVLALVAGRRSKKKNNKSNKSNKGKSSKGKKSK